MKQQYYQMEQAFISSRVCFCDSFITHIEVQSDTVLYTFANGVITNVHTPDLSFERTGKAICRIKHEYIEDILCRKCRKYCLFGKLVSFGKEMAFSQLIDEINKGKISLEIIQEYYYSGRMYWICARRKTMKGKAAEVVIRVDSIKQFEVAW